MAGDFDFQIGSWRVRHRRLKARLVGCDDWEEFYGLCDMRPILGGDGNVEDNILDMPGGTYRAIALRSFDPARKSWAIWWLIAVGVTDSSCAASLALRCRAAASKARSADREGRERG